LTFFSARATMRDYLPAPLLLRRARTQDIENRGDTMASRARAADDFKTINQALTEIQRGAKVKR
jgi:hypothetical protein